MKIGDYGFTTRRYYYPRSAERSCNAYWGRNIVMLFLAGTVAFWIHSENAHSSFKTALGDTFRQNVTVWNDGQSVLRGIEGKDPNDSGQLGPHLLAGVEVESVSTLTDADFGLQVDDSLSLRREVQYCQWVEYRHERRVNDEEVEVSYTYAKGWHDHRISSIFYDNPIAFHNPGRNPFPSFTLDSLVVVKTNDNIRGIIPGLARGTKGDERWDDVLISTDLPPTPLALQEGCQRSDGRWIYCQAAPGTTFGGIASFLFDGVISLGLSGSCEPGDIRVRWRRVPAPKHATFVATPLTIGAPIALPESLARADVQDLWNNIGGNKLIFSPTKLSDGTESYFYLPGKRTLIEVEQEFVNRANNSMFYTRLALLFISVILSFVLRNMNHELREEEEVQRLRSEGKKTE